MNDTHAVNLILAAWRWNETPAKKVVPGLRAWRCGTQACFGGHLATWPEFRAQGVHVVSFSHEPAIGLQLSDEVSEILFGAHTLFMPSGLLGDERNAWAAVRERLEDQFERVT